MQTGHVQLQAWSPLWYLIQWCWQIKSIRFNAASIVWTHRESVIFLLTCCPSVALLLACLSMFLLRIYTFKRFSWFSPHLPTEKTKYKKQIHQQTTRATSYCKVSMLNIKACDSTVSKRLKKRGLLGSVWKTLLSIKNMQHSLDLQSCVNKLKLLEEHPVER